jgi:hypothetical protein
MHLILGRLDLGAKGIWYPISLVVILILFILFMKKRQLTWRQIYATFGVVCAVTWIVDMIVSIYFDAYRFGTNHSIGLADLLALSFIPSCLSIIYLNFRTKSNKWMMLVGFTVLSLAIELIATRVQYFQLKYWKLYYSLVMYLIIYGCLLPLHLHVLKSGV